MTICLNEILTTNFRSLFSLEKAIMVCVRWSGLDDQTVSKREEKTAPIQSATSGKDVEFLDIRDRRRKVAEALNQYTGPAGFWKETP